MFFFLQASVYMNRIEEHVSLSILIDWATSV